MTWLTVVAVNNNYICKKKYDQIHDRVWQIRLPS